MQFYFFCCEKKEQFTPYSSSMVNYSLFYRPIHTQAKEQDNILAYRSFAKGMELVSFQSYIHLIKI